mgnify:CR=1 FL=1
MCIRDRVLQELLLVKACGVFSRSMYLIRGQNNINLFKKRHPNVSMSATIGNFDGLHLGHQAILKNLKEEARQLDTSTLVFFTEPHAAEYFSNKGLIATKSPPRLCPWREKFRLLNNFGIEYACFLKFNSSLKSMEPKVFIKDILEAEKSKINDELATRMGLPDLKSLKEAIKNQIEINYKATARNRIKRDLLDKLSKEYSFDVPKTMLENENKVIWDRFEQDRKEGVIDEIDKGKKDSVLKKEYSEIAERRVRLGLLMAEIGDVNKIIVTEDEIKTAVMQEARKYPGEENKVIEFYQKNPEAANAVKAPLFEEKVVDHIISKCCLLYTSDAADE